MWVNFTTDVVMQLRKVQLVVNGKEETAVAVYWVTDGIDRCCPGFLSRHMTRHANANHNLAQVMDVFTQLSASPTSKKISS